MSSVFLDVSSSPNAPAQRLEFELFDAAAPRACANFRALCVGARAGAGGGPAATAAANTAVPDAFTDEQLAAMSKEEARTLLSEISKARRRNELDADTRKRLADDFQRILEHLKK